MSVALNASAVPLAASAVVLAQADAPGLGQSFTYLFVGSLAAVGAALALGTLGAILRYHRTGAFPGHDAGQEVPTRRYVGLWIRVVVGAGAGRLRHRGRRRVRRALTRYR